MKSLYHYNFYKDYMEDVFPPKGKGRGGRAQLARFLGCQTGFVSQVINHDSHFSLEHAYNVSRFLGHSEEEARYFVLLVQKDRAGSRELENFFWEQVKKTQTEHLEPSKKVKTSTEPSQSTLNVYYSHWLYAAVHILATIPAYQTLESLSQKLSLSPQYLRSYIDFLVENALIKQTNQTYVSEPVRLHLPKGSRLLSRHHTNWRLQAIQSLDRSQPSDIHYSAVLAFAKKDEKAVRRILLEALENIEKVISPSKEEDLYILNFDFYNHT